MSGNKLQIHNLKKKREKTIAQATYFLSGI